MPLIDEAYCRALLAESEGAVQEGVEPDRDLPYSQGESTFDQADAFPDSERDSGTEGAEGEGLTAQDAFKRIVRLSRVRERSAHEMRTRLRKEAYGEAAIEGGLAKACGCGLIDDMRFADMIIRSRIQAGKGMMGIAAELERNDIRVSSVPGWPEDYLPENEVERAMALLRRRPPTARNKREGAYRRLISKGFSASVASSAARLWLESSE